LSTPLLLLLSLIPCPPSSTLFPYTTLFRSNSRLSADKQLRAAKGGYLPSVDLLGGYGREGSDNTTTRGAGDHWKTMTRGESSLRDRKSTRLNSSHVKISYAVVCLKKKNKKD